MICKQCGAELADNARFCFHCGAQIAGPEPDPSGAGETTVLTEDMMPPLWQPQAPVQQPQAPVQQPQAPMRPPQAPVQQPYAAAPQYAPPAQRPPKKKKSKAPVIIIVILLLLVLAAGAAVTLKFLNDKGYTSLDIGFLDDIFDKIGISFADGDDADSKDDDEEDEETTEKDKKAGKDETEGDTVTDEPGMTSTSVTQPGAEAESETVTQAPPAAPAVAVLKEDSGGNSTSVSDKTPVFGNTSYQRADITSVVFTNNIGSAPASGAWDVSASGNGSVKAWVTNGRLTIAAAGTIRPQSCYLLFFGYTNAVSIDFGGIFDTSEATSMTGMFGADMALTTLDLSGFATAKVSDMSYMFADCVSMPAFHLESFTIGSSTNVTDMFALSPGATRKNKDVKVYTNSGSYTLENAAPATPEDPSNPSDPGQGTAYEPGTYKVNTQWLRLRQSPSLSGYSMGLIAEGTVLNVTEVSVDQSAESYDAVYWGKILYNGKTGWVAMYYLVPAG